VICPRHPDDDGPSWCQECHPATYLEKYGVDLSALEKLYEVDRSEEPVRAGRPYCSSCRSYFCPHLTPHLYHEPGELETAIKDWERVARERYGSER
jgi:hypothetical protein